MDLSHLNSEQRRAVETTEGPLLILAGAGAGKTKTITERIRALIHKGVTPSQILAITFTNKAAKEMRERTEAMLEADKDLNRPISMFERPFVSTFHALGVHILKEQARLLNLPRHFRIYDRSESLSAIKTALKEASFDPQEHEPAKILSGISRKKGDGLTFEMYADDARGEWSNRVTLAAWEGYEKLLTADKALDFDDLLLKTMLLLKNNEEVRAHYQNVWKYIHIDEYQDTNKVQYDTAKLLTGKENNICVVGDIDQSIYSWRGADFKNIMRFEKDYPDTVTILLEQNYRSTKTILKAANTVIAKNVIRKDKNLFTDNGDGEKIGLYAAYNEADEARHIAEEIASAVAAGTSAREIAILYRANFQSRVLEEALLYAGIPHQVLGTRFFDRAEVKDILAYIRAALNPENMTDMKRVINTPARGIGKTTILKLFGGTGEELPAATLGKIQKFKNLLVEIKEKALQAKPSETISHIIEESGMRTAFEADGEEGQERLENAYELVALASKYDVLPPEEGIEALLSDAALATDQDSLVKNPDAVKLMTVHASKGLEFDVVFITGLESDLFPHRRRDARQNQEESEEERRLFYVALTRARQKLHLSYTAVRTIFGSKQINMPSEFIADIADELIETNGDESAFKGKVIYLE